MSRITELQAQIRTCEEVIALQDAIDRLNHNNDFRKLQQYFETKATESALSLSEYTQGDWDYNEVVRTMDAISRYFAQITSIARKADKARGDIQEARRYLGESED